MCWHKHAKISCEQLGDAQVLIPRRGAAPDDADITRRLRESTGIRSLGIEAGLMVRQPRCPVNDARVHEVKCGGRGVHPLAVLTQWVVMHADKPAHVTSVTFDYLRRGLLDVMYCIEICSPTVSANSMACPEWLVHQQHDLQTGEAASRARCTTRSTTECAQARTSLACATVAWQLRSGMLEARGRAQRCPSTSCPAWCTVCAAQGRMCQQLDRHRWLAPGARLRRWWCSWQTRLTMAARRHTYPVCSQLAMITE